MTERPKLLQKLGEQRRLAAALRENLKRRKAQATARDKARAASEHTCESSGKAHETARIADDK
jgi:hypothetical protein